MKKALITLTVVAWTVGLFIEMGWLALVILPIALIFMAATLLSARRLKQSKHGRSDKR